MTACTRIGILRFLEAAEESENYNIYSKIQSFKKPRNKVEMHNCAAGHANGAASGSVSMLASRLSAILAAAAFTESRARRVAGGRLDLTVAEDLLDHRHAFTEHESPRGK